MKKAIAILFLFFGVYLQSNASDPTTYDFLRLPVGARSAGLNGSFVSMTNDPNGIFINPATLSTLGSRKASVGFVRHLMDVNAGNLSYGQHFEGLGTIGGGIIFIDYGSFELTDESMNRLGVFGARELAIVTGIGREIGESILIGANLKYIYSTISTFSSSALALDLGLLYSIPEENITLGASILNLGSQLTKYSNTRESLPLDFKIGITKKPEHLPVLLNLNFHKLVETTGGILQRFENFTAGAEFLMTESFKLRLGYNNEQRKELKIGTSSGLAGFSFGAGFSYQMYELDYSFNSYGKIGDIHRISLGFSL